MRKLILIISGVGFLVISGNAQLISNSKINPVSQEPDTTNVQQTQNSNENKSELNSTTRKNETTPIKHEEAKKEEEMNNPVTNSSSKNPK